MTADELDALIEELGPLAQSAVGEIHDGILAAAAAKLVEASEKDASSDAPQAIKLAVGLKMIIRLDMSPPKCYVTAQVSRPWKGVGVPDGESTPRAQTSRERVAAHRERERAAARAADM